MVFSSTTQACIKIDLNDDQRRMTVLLEGEIGGRQVQTALCEVIRRRPDVTGYDFFFDLRRYRGDVSANDLDPLVELYASVRQADAEGARTAFLTPDPLFGLWATAMNYQFPGRAHGVFAGKELSEDFLAEPRASRSAAPAKL